MASPVDGPPKSPSGPLRVGEILRHIGFLGPAAPELPTPETVAQTALSFAQQFRFADSAAAYLEAARLTPPEGATARRTYEIQAAQVLIDGARTLFKRGGDLNQVARFVDDAIRIFTPHASDVRLIELHIFASAVARQQHRYDAAVQHYGEALQLAMPMPQMGDQSLQEMQHHLAELYLKRATALLGGVDTVSYDGLHTLYQDVLDNLATAVALHLRLDEHPRAMTLNADIQTYAFQAATRFMALSKLPAEFVALVEACRWLLSNHQEMAQYFPRLLKLAPHVRHEETLAPRGSIVVGDDRPQLQDEKPDVSDILRDALGFELVLNVESIFPQMRVIRPLLEWLELDVQRRRSAAAQALQRDQKNQAVSHLYLGQSSISTAVTFMLGQIKAITSLGQPMHEDGGGFQYLLVLVEEAERWVSQMDALEQERAALAEEKWQGRRVFRQKLSHLTPADISGYPAALSLLARELNVDAQAVREVIAGDDGDRRVRADLLQLIDRCDLGQLLYVSPHRRLWEARRVMQGLRLANPKK